MNNTPRILIVDDEVRMCDSLKMLLSTKGYEIQTAYSGREAIACLANNNFDLVILDLVLPDTDGYTLLDNIDRQSPGTLVIIMTGYASLKSAVQTLRKGAYDYLKKPFEHEELLKTIKNALDHKRLERERKKAEEEKHKLEAQLKRSEKMETIGTLAGGIAHNFNNILASIIGYTEMSIEDIPEGNLAREKLKQVLMACNRAKDLVKQILAFSRQDRLEKKPVNISHIVEESLKMLRSTIPTTVEIRQNISCPSDIIMGEAAQIEQVLLNLCINAEQSMDDTGGVIEVSLANVEINADEVKKYSDITQPGTYVKLTVSDTGHGIDLGIIDKIFDPFFTSKELAAGSGLGLSTTHGIVRSHNGTITVESKPGKGATFHVLFPVIEVKAEPEAATFEPPLTGKGNILFVDDEELMINMAKLSLERLGYEVTVKKDGLEALETFRNQPGRFDLVITDQIMPRMTGEKLAKELLKIRKDIPIILSSGRGDSITDEKINNLGIKGFLMKPYDRRDIAKTIREVLE